jgi:sugar/nucleoside kinase (ribokinase family)
MTPSDMSDALIAAALSGAALVYFDGRLTEAALLLARAARARGVPVLVEGERLRPGLEALLAEADYVVTSAHFPQVRGALSGARACTCRCMSRGRKDV